MKSSTVKALLLFGMGAGAAVAGREFVESPLWPGTPTDPPRMEATLDNLVNQLQDAGYAIVDVKGFRIGVNSNVGKCPMPPVPKDPAEPDIVAIDRAISAVRAKILAKHYGLERVAFEDGRCWLVPTD